MHNIWCDVPEVMLIETNDILFLSDEQALVIVIDFKEEPTHLHTQNRDSHVDRLRTL